MARKYLSRCWLCHSTDLEPDTRGVTCRKCGATFNLIPKPGSDCITMQDDTAATSYDFYPGKSSSPSAIIQRQAAKARGDI